MREIKFRGKTKTVKGTIWAYGYLYKVKSFFDKEYQYFIRDEHLQDVIVDEKTIGQYAGLHDKNGKEIYEGDVVEITRPCILEKGEVRFINGCFTIKSKDTLLMLYQCEINNFKLKVIGNIYENKELLEA